MENIDPNSPKKALAKIEEKTFMAGAFTRRNLLKLAGAGVLLLGGCADTQRVKTSRIVRDHIDTTWFSKMLADETEHWLKAAATPSGFFQVTLDREWRPVGQQIATLTSQNRQIYVMATGYDLTGNTVYLEAVKKGADFLLANFRDGKYGGMFYSVSPDGKVVEDRKDSYGTAFAIFGLSHAARVSGETRYKQAALETWSDMKKYLRDTAGFYKAGTTRDFSQRQGTNSQNPMMHLFEALLALHDATGSKEVYKDAQDHGDSMFTKLFQEGGGYLPEVYDDDWVPLPVSTNGRIDIGHQFEWAFLLSRAVEKGFHPKYLTIGERLLAYGMKVGYDRENGGIFSTSDYDGNSDKGPKSWWQQNELLRAIIHYAALRDHPGLWEPFDQSLAFVKQNFIDTQYGGWYASYDPVKTREGRALYKGRPEQVGYHVCGMYAEALRLAGHLVQKS